MDKYEFNIKVEQLQKLVRLGDYQTAMRITDSIDWRRVHNTSLLTLVSEVYEKNKDYKEAKYILNLAYDRMPGNKRMLFKLVGLALKDGEIEEAQAYYKEYEEVAPDDVRRYILRYMVLDAKNESLDARIIALEAYTRTELDEKWLYELALCYHKAKRSEDCVRVCDSIMLLFGLGKYVDKAIDLKMNKEGVELTEYQQGLIDNRAHYEEKLKEVELQYGYEADKEEVAFNESERELIISQLNASEEMERVVEEEEYDEEKIPSLGTIEADTQTLESLRSMDEEIKAHIQRLEASIQRREEVLEEEPEEEEDLGITIEEESESEEIADATNAHEIIESDEEVEDLSGDEEVPEQIPTQDDVVVEALEDTKNAREEIEDSSRPYALLVVGKTPGEALEVAIAELKAINAKEEKSNPVVKIKAGKLNILGVEASADKIAGKDVIIEEAGDLSEDSVLQILALIQNHMPRTFLLLDNPLQIGNLVKSYRELVAVSKILPTDFLDVLDINSEKTVPIETVQEEVTDKEKEGEGVLLGDTQRVDIPGKATEEVIFNTQEEMDLDTFVEYATAYAKAIDCTISGKSMLSLYERAEILEEDGYSFTKENAEMIINEAADRAEKPPLSKKLMGMFSPKYDKEGKLILGEEHFLA